jgi:hypothetical protein
VGLREWWRRRAARGEEEEREPDAATILVAPERGAGDATILVDPESYGEAAPGLVTEAIPQLGAGRGRAAPADPGLAPTRVEGAVRAGRPRVVGVVVAVEGEFEGRAFPLFEGTNRLGREHVCEICLPSERVAPQHVCIEYRSGFFRLERIAEPEVRVNFEPVAGSLLRDGDAIQLGMTTFRFRSIVGA